MVYTLKKIPLRKINFFLRTLGEIYNYIIYNIFSKYLSTHIAIAPLSSKSRASRMCFLTTQLAAWNVAKRHETRSMKRGKAACPYYKHALVLYLADQLDEWYRKQKDHPK